MNHLFRNKKISILIVAAIVLVLVLVCMLLAFLAQMTSLKQNAERLQLQIQQQCDKKIELEELKEFMQTDEYVKRWAENNGRMSSDDILWIAEQLGGNN